MTDPEEDPPSSITLVRQSITMLEDVGRMLEALSPSEIERASAAHLHFAYFDRLGAEHAARWKMYSARYHVFRDLFATQAERFAGLARAYFAAKRAGSS